MSIDRIAPVLALALVLSFTPASRAARTVFDPSVELSYSVDGNPDIVGDGEQEPESDEVAGIALDLKLRITGRTTESELSYRPFYQAYAEDADRNHVEHVVSFGLESTPGPRLSTRLRLDAASSERQGVGRDVGLPTTLVPRSRIDSGSIAVSQSIAAGQRLTWNWSLSGGATRFDDAEASTVSLEDSSEYRFGTGFRHASTRRVAFGLDLDGEMLEYDTRQDTAVVGLSAALDVQAGKFTTWSLSGGVQRAENDGGAETSPSFGVAVSREISNRSSLSAGGRRSVSRGTGLAGATRDLGLFVGYAVNPGRSWSFRTRIAYWDREELEIDAAEPTSVESLVTTTTIDWYVTRRISVGVQHEYRDQSAPRDVTEPVVANDHSGGIFLRVQALGRDGSVRR